MGIHTPPLKKTHVSAPQQGKLAPITSPSGVAQHSKGGRMQARPGPGARGQERPEARAGGKKVGERRVAVADTEVTNGGSQWCTINRATRIRRRRSVLAITHRGFVPLVAGPAI